MGVPTCILIADYQVLTDHEAFSEISQNTKQLVIDYLAAGIKPSDKVPVVKPRFNRAEWAQKEAEKGDKG